MDSENRNVFMCLDVKKYSFAGSTNVNGLGVVIILFFTLGYWTLAFSFLNIFMMMLDTLSKTTPMVTYVIVYVLIVQKLIRVFIIKEKERLAEFLEQSHNNIATLGDFYDVKSSGYEKHERTNPRTGKSQEFHKIQFRDGTDEYAIKFSRGSITSEYNDIESTQIKTTCNFLNTLMSQSIVPRIILSDERIERAVAFKFYQHKLKTGSFHEEFIDLCNSTLLYHEQVAESYSRISATYYLTPARTAKQKVFLNSYIKNVGNNIKFSSFRDASPMNKIQILNMFKDLNCLNSINERDLQTEEANRRVPIGISKALYTKNILTGEVVTLNESDIQLKLNIKGIDYDLKRKIGTQDNQPANQESTKDIKVQLEDDIFDDLELPDIDLEDELPDMLDMLEEKEELPEPKLVDVNAPVLQDGVFDFKHTVESVEEVDKFILLLNNIQNEDCDTIVL